ncbi:5-guanidino-2-oxopentanoate decarboxylase [Aestuariicella hydrocarbonica]|uniref:5-guanidino-2-oxopentanoate decarboxylase n=1 Tax=Pseudomaricurvus hydrocarbonicus TaxID=1470433 RepID=A0A9E5JSA2_9GAMM|nr:5-guanidino-2-oxopentanoate decarboxylase [Aestuariicella hydrocarbonica]NHO65838.1 5-guanidino-2-oxopentanoate decarboxylase [Aestuariicella hydrocarbonica]
MKTCGTLIPELLKSYGVDTIFGIPGVHSVEMYRGIEASGLRHITPRHEQGAGFMADGYARATGKPGVCFIITGPGMTNIVTAMGQALQDSIPMLVISAVNGRADLAMGEGRLHELPNQLALTSEVSRYSHTLMDVKNLPKVLAHAFSIFNSQRPGPVHIEIPLDVMIQDASAIDTSAWPLPQASVAAPQAIAEAAQRLNQAKRPLMVLGGGAGKASAPVTALAETLGMPVINTNNAKGVLPASHPLAVGGSPSLKHLRDELEQHADVILAVGTEFAETDYDFFFLGDLNIQGQVIRIDIDAGQLCRNVKADIPLLGDAAQTCASLANQIDRAAAAQLQQGEARAAQLREAQIELRDPDYQAFFSTIHDVLPDAIIVGDSTQPAYFAQVHHNCEKPGRYFHSATGFGTLGYAFPAAQGAKLGQPELPVLCLTGDGGGQFSLNELSSAVEANLKVIFLVWNNQGHGEIRRFMDDKDVPQIGVNIHTPDYAALAEACGMRGANATSLAEFEQCLRDAADHDGPCLINIAEAGLVSGYPW